MPPVQVVVVAGFLGAGKTSLVNHLIRQSGDIRLAVVVNDFGSINVDADLVVGIEGDVYGLSNGCVCCSIRDDLIDTCLRIIRRFAGLDLLIVEASGASDSLQVANAFLRPDLRGVMEVSAILGVADASLFPSYRTEVARLVAAQLWAADIVVLNKVDLVSAAALTATKALIRGTAPKARIVEACHSNVPLELVLGEVRHGSAHNRSRLRADAGGDAHSYLATWRWEQSRPLALDRLRSAFAALPDGIYRAKGFVLLDETPSHKVLLQSVGRRSSLEAVGLWNGETPATRIVMIGAPEAIGAASLNAALDGCVADPASPSPLKSFAARLLE